MSTSPRFLRWRAPQPLWPLALRDTHLRRFDQPAILRFVGDKFMEEMMAAAQQVPVVLDPLVVRPETGARPDVGWQAQMGLERSRFDLKLYHPGNFRFYLVAASLVEQLPGLPDATLSPDDGDAVSFVVRRLVQVPPAMRDYPGELFRELAWVEGEAPEWVPVEALDVLPGEARLPLFSLPMRPMGRPAAPGDRSLHVGVIPVQNRALYETVPAGLPGDPPHPDVRLLELTNRVLDPMAEVAQMEDAEVAGSYSTMLLLELSAFLHQEFPWLWEEAAIRPAWRGVIKQLWEERAALLTGIGPAPAYDLRDALQPGNLEALARSVFLVSLDQAAADAVPPSPRGEYYTVRCIYERPGRPPVVSDAAPLFQMAELMDSQAPQRPGIPDGLVGKLMGLVKLPGASE